MLATIIALVIVGGIGFTLLNRYVFVPMMANQPDNLGWDERDGFREINNPMNHVSSTINPDNMAYIQPIAFEGSSVDAHNTLLAIIKEMPRHEIITDDDQYIHVIFRSFTMGFPDDAEFYIDAENGAIEGIMAARLGQGDMGMNRRRFEQIRSAFEQRFEATPVQEQSEEHELISA